MIDEGIRDEVLLKSSLNRLDVEDFSGDGLIRFCEMMGGCAPAGALSEGFNNPAAVMMCMLAGHALGLTLLQSLMLGRVKGGVLTFEDYDLEAEEESKAAVIPPPAEAPTAHDVGDARVIQLDYYNEELFDQLELDRPVHWRRFASVGVELGHILHKNQIARSPRNLLNLVASQGWRGHVTLLDKLRGDRRLNVIEELCAWCAPLPPQALEARFGQMQRVVSERLAASSVAHDEEAAKVDADAEAARYEASCYAQAFDELSQRLTKNGFFDQASHARDALMYELESAGGNVPDALCQNAARLIERIRRHRGEVS